MTVKSLLVKIGVDTSELEAGLGKIQTSLKAHEAQFRKVGGVLTAVGGGLTALFGMAVKQAAEQESAVSRLRAALANVEGVTDASGASLIKLAGVLQQVTGISDEEILSAQALLATFGFTDTQIATLTPRLLDMAVATAKSSGEQVNLNTTALALGKGLNGMEGAFSRYGVVLSEEAKKTGDFNLIVKELDGKFQGAATAAGQTFSGQLQILGQSLGEVMETIGAKLLPILAPLLEKISSIAMSVVGWIEKNEGLMKVLLPVVAVVGVFSAILGPILIALPMLAGGFSLLLGPVGLVAAAIMGLITVGVLVMANWDSIKAFFISTWEAIKTALTTTITAIGGFITSTWESIKTFFQTILETIKLIFSMAWEAIKLGVSISFETIKIIIRTAIDAVVSVFNFFKETAVGIFESLGKAIVEKFTWIFNKVGEIAGKIKDVTVGIFTSMWKKVTGGSIIPEMAASVILNFQNMQTQSSAAIEALRTTSEQGFFKISEYAQAMDTASSGAFTSMEGSLKASGRSIIETLKKQALAYIVTKVMAALPFPFNLAAVGVAIAAVNALFAPLKLAEGGLVTKPALAMVGEKGPELVVPLDKLGMIGAGGTTLKQYNYFYGNFNNTGDIEEISRRLASRTIQAIERGRK